MGFFKEIEIDVIDMFHSEGMKETEIATSLGISLTQVNEILAAYDRRDDDADTDEVVSYDDLVSEPDDSDYNSEHY
jgi:transposase